MGNSQFEWQPDLEGVKTLELRTLLQWLGFEWQPDLEGVKTRNQGHPRQRLAFEWQPDLEGVKTASALAGSILDISLNGSLI